ncbi:lysozyme inhibitor LprI family protein [Dryocola sp. BD626]|uniref:lysozyme inhibitor LprI family protein n=1 Tax=Dryocola sp. BD626 TaxID=3133273 RepID=UPI003F4FC83B
MKAILLSVLLLTGVSLQATAASFDCNKAKAADEKTICANRDLNDKDVQLATKYTFLKGLFAMGARGEMQDGQRAWLKSRQQCGKDKACLTKRYDERLQQLDDIYSRINKPL